MSRKCRIPMYFREEGKMRMGGGRHQFVWEIKRETSMGSQFQKVVLKPWNRMVFITHKQSLEDFLLEISFHEKLKILSFRYRH